MTVSANAEPVDPSTGEGPTAAPAADGDIRTVVAAPGLAAGMVEESLANSIGQAFANAVAEQHLQHVELQAATMRAVTEILLGGASHAAGERSVPNLSSLAAPAADDADSTSSVSPADAVIEQLDRFVVDEAARVAAAVVESTEAFVAALGRLDLLAFLRSVDMLAIGLTVAAASGEDTKVGDQLDVLTKYATTRFGIVAEANLPVAIVD